MSGRRPRTGGVMPPEARVQMVEWTGLRGGARRRFEIRRGPVRSLEEMAGAGPPPGGTEPADTGEGRLD